MNREMKKQITDEQREIQHNEGFIPVIGPMTKEEADYAAEITRGLANINRNLLEDCSRRDREIQKLDARIQEQADRRAELLQKLADATKSSVDKPVAQKQAAVIKIQSLFRRAIAQTKKLREVSARKIQSIFRGRLVRLKPVMIEKIKASLAGKTKEKDRVIEELSKIGKPAMQKVYGNMDSNSSGDWGKSVLLSGLTVRETFSAISIAAGGIKETFKVIAFLFSTRENVELISRIFEDSDKVIHVSSGLFDRLREWSTDKSRRKQHQYLARLANTIGLTDDQLYEVNRKIEAGHKVPAGDPQFFNSAYAPFMKTLLGFQKEKFGIGRSE